MGLFRWLFARRLIQVMKVEPNKKYVLFIPESVLNVKSAKDLANYLWKECFDATIVLVNTAEEIKILEMNEHT